jgi:peptide-methionine (R)-S-oxide reductase
MKTTVLTLLALLVVAILVIAFRDRAHADQSPETNTSDTTKSTPVLPTSADLAPARKVVKSEDEWKTQLTPAQYSVLRKKGTERAGSSELLHEHRRGVFVCAACGQPLFGSDAKFESGTGWPSFTKPFFPRAVNTAKDRSFFVEREEVLCARCGGHLGHVFDDGPAPTGLRYCMNGVALKFQERP